jgi:hypothetical protein
MIFRFMVRIDSSIDSGIDSIDTLRFWHQFLSIPLIRYFRQAWQCYSKWALLSQKKNRSDEG